MAASRSSPDWCSAIQGPMLALAALALASLACSLPNFGGRVDPVIKGSWAAEIGPEGGRISTPNLQLEVPAGALAESIEIHVDIVQSDNPADLIAFELSPGGHTFEAPVTVTVSYADLLPAEAEPRSLSLIHASEQGEQPVTDQVLDRQAREISGNIEHFSSIFLRLLEGEAPSSELSGEARVEEAEDGLKAQYNVDLAYQPDDQLWRLSVQVALEDESGLFDHFAAGETAVEGDDLLTEGSLPLDGMCQFNYGDQSARRHAFDGIMLPFQILSPADPKAGDTVTVRLNPDSLELWAFDDEGGSACPAFGPHGQNFEVQLFGPMEPLDSLDDLE